MALDLLGTFRMDTGEPSQEELDLCARAWRRPEIVVVTKTDDYSCYSNFGSLLYNLALPMFVHLASCPYAETRDTKFFVRDLGLASRALPALLPDMHIEYAEFVPQCCGECMEDTKTFRWPPPPPWSMAVIQFFAARTQYLLTSAGNLTFIGAFRWSVSKFLTPVFNQAFADPNASKAVTFVYRGYMQGRHGASRRSISNSEVVQQFLKHFAQAFSRAFETVDFQAHSLISDIRLMQRTQILVGQHGAGMHNCLFLQKGSFVVELARAWKLGYRSIFWPSVSCTMLRDVRYYAFEEEIWAERFLAKEGIHHPVDIAGLERFLLRQVVDRTRLTNCFPMGTGLSWDSCCSRLHGLTGNAHCWSELARSGVPEANYAYCC